MFNQNVAIVVGETTTNYALTSITNGKSVRNNASASMGTPDVFQISHETKGKGSAAVDRHLIRLDTSYESVESGVSTIATATAYIVLVAPHKVVTSTNVKDAYKKLASFLAATEAGASSDNLARILNNEP